jgi:hypothetical protein
MIFDCEDIHRMRLEMAERYSKMSKEDAERDFKQRAENGRRAIEEITPRQFTESKLTI